MPLIQAIYKSFLKRIPNVTLFSENLFPFSESNFHYSVKNDTWTIQSMFRPLFDTKVVDIQSKEDIYKCFKNVKVANGDVITFND